MKHLKSAVFEWHNNIELKLQEGAMIHLQLLVSTQKVEYA